MCNQLKKFPLDYDYRSSDGYGRSGTRGDCGHPASRATSCPAFYEDDKWKVCGGKPRGVCDNTTFVCKCAADRYGADCMLRRCPAGVSWWGEARGENQPHDLRECSGMGARSARVLSRPRPIPRTTPPPRRPRGRSPAVRLRGLSTQRPFAQIDGAASRSRPQASASGTRASATVGRASAAERARSSCVRWMPTAGTAMAAADVCRCGASRKRRRPAAARRRR